METATDHPALSWPVAGPVTQEYGHNGHPGIDIGVPTGTVVRASGVGTVSDLRPTERSGGYGNLVVVNHGAGWETYYAHNDRFVAKVGQRVGAGDEVARSGSTGKSTGPHVHFEVRTNGATRNPRTYIGGNPGDAGAVPGPSVTTGTAVVDPQAPSSGLDLSKLSALVSLAVDGHTWMRLVGLLLGGGLLIAGIVIVAGDTTQGQQVITTTRDVAVKAAETAAVA